VQTAVYLLPLRHPVTVARQVTTLAALAPGRFEFGVGVGGEDPAEARACGVAPATRGRRTDEALAVLRRLLAGDEVTMSGEFFSLDRVRVEPSPLSPVPIVVGGRSDAALRRAARYGDGWLGLWVSPSRYADATARIAAFAADAGRVVLRWRHGMHVWCAFGDSAVTARSRLAASMENFYQTPFGKFERYCPCGTPEEVAAGLQAYVDAGCRSFNLIPLADSEELAIAGADAVRAALRGPAAATPAAGTGQPERKMVSVQEGKGNG
jgi:alkanesulfonate monooxygenase SsuD/methylene tetrahydromethanopterin reductase-like flavin-dependent oxidoreductase (luciferase family)